MSTPSFTAPVDSSRKSRRLQLKTNGEDEAACSTTEECTEFPRGTITPTGTQRVPFSSLPKGENDRTRREQKRLMGTLCSLPKPTNHKDNQVLVGKNHQAEVEEFVPQSSSDKYLDRDEQIWTPAEVEDVESNKTRDVYWKIVWRQFDGQIPFESALKNLWENDYDIPKSLETVDQYLNVVAQKFEPLAEVQFKKFEKLWKKKTTGNRDIQETAMRNYHIAEVQNFYHDYKRLKKQTPGICNCNEPLVEDLEFEPRWACSNCTKNHRANLLPTDHLCLLCKSYTEMTGESRPVWNIVFLDEDLQKIHSWVRMEKEQRRRLSKEKFERIQKQERTERLMRMELTEEEKDIMDGTPVTKKSIGEKLEPHPLPLFRKCQCGKLAVEDRDAEIQPAVTGTSADEVVEEVQPTVVEPVVPITENVEVVTAPKRQKKEKKRIATEKFNEDLEHLPTKRERKPKKIHDV